MYKASIKNLSTIVLMLLIFQETINSITYLGPPFHNYYYINLHRYINFDNQITAYNLSGIFIPLALQQRHLIICLSGTYWLITLI